GLTYGIMAGLVNGIKYTSKELRPDGSTYNSWPSGHTATSFAGATILHKEYGLTRSPWYSVAGYGVATATGVMRVLNNRHWVSDVLSGAGIGIMSGELAYMISDLIFKDKYLLRNDMEAFPDLTRKPSFFSVSMGIGFGSHELDFSGLESETWEGITMDDLKLDFQMSTVVGAEGAYFFNRYVGVGGRLRVRTSPIKGWGQVLDYAEKDIQEHVEGWQELDSDGDFNVDGDVKTMLTDKAFSIESDHLTEFALDAGLYFSIPLSKRFAIGTKLLIGSSRMQALDLNAHFKGTVWNLDYSYDMRNGELKYETFSLDGMRQLLDDQGNPKTFETEWDYFTLEGNRSTKYGTGLSLTYAHKHNFSWRLFMDYDYTRKTYTLTKDSEHFMQYLMPNLVDLGGLSADIYTPEVYRMKKNMHQWVLGGAFCISF
ncbi:MAG: phosphatase PAP2 family protein, partial [Bacteroidales bacterium]|nr:phosphatase PAP2 family protein [Bacteroidales bacterium]